jgi:hypothetical protein
MTATSVDGEASFACCLMVAVSRLRHYFRAATRLLRHRFSASLLEGGGGMEVEGAEHDSASRSKSLAVGKS